MKPEEILRFFFQSNQRLQRFLNYLQLDWSQLLPRPDFQRSQLLSMLRELMEWAALRKLASQPPVKLLIRDGLLRSVLLNDVVFQRLREKFETLTTKHGHLLVGVAKRSRVLSYLGALQRGAFETQAQLRLCAGGVGQAQPHQVPCFPALFFAARCGAAHLRYLRLHRAMRSTL